MRTFLSLLALRSPGGGIEQREEELAEAEEGFEICASGHVGQASQALHRLPLDEAAMLLEILQESGSAAFECGEPLRRWTKALLLGIDEYIENL